MSSDESIECISPSSNASWDILSPEERDISQDVPSDEEVVTICSVCGHFLSNGYFHHESCAICTLCSSCFTTVRGLNCVPNCQHSDSYDPEDTLFHLDDLNQTVSACGPVTQSAPLTGCSSPCIVPSTRPSSPEDDDLSDFCFKNDVVAEGADEYHPVNFQLGTSHQGSVEAENKLLTTEWPDANPTPIGGAPSIMANVIEALHLTNAPSELRRQVTQTASTVIPGSIISTQQQSPTSLATVWDSLAANLRHSSLPHSSQTSSVSVCESDSSAERENARDKSSSSLSGLMNSSPKSSSLIPTQRPMVQLMRTSCPSSECHTSSNSAGSPPSPQSLSSSPLNVATKFLKSMVIHSAAALNNFDALPLNNLDRGSPTQGSPSIGNPTYASTAPDPHCTPLLTASSIPPGSTAAVFPESVDIMADFSPQIKYHVWDQHRLKALIQPKPVPKSVTEIAAFNLR